MEYHQRSSLSEWFSVQSGVRVGCIISPILFLVAIDWITTNTTADRPADDLALLSTNQYNTQAKTDRLNNFARQLGLSINTSKTQVTCVNSIPTAPIPVNEKPLEFVEDFTCLGWSHQ